MVEYVFSSLLMLAERDGFALRDRTVGIVGVGNVGGRLQKRPEALGIKTLLCDPPRADRGDEGDFRLEALVQKPMSSPSIRRCIKKGNIKPCIWRMRR